MCGPFCVNKTIISALLIHIRYIAHACNNYLQPMATFWSQTPFNSSHLWRRFNSRHHEVWYIISDVSVAKEVLPIAATVQHTNWPLAFIYELAYTRPEYGWMVGKFHSEVWMHIFVTHVSPSRFHTQCLPVSGKKSIFVTRFSFYRPTHKPDLPIFILQV